MSTGIENPGGSSPAASRARKKPSGNRTLFYVIGGFVLVAVLYFAYSQFTAKPSTGKLIMGTVKRGDLIETVTATGSVNAQTGAEVHIGSQITGVIKRLNADVGAKVKAGEVIAELDLPDLVAQLNQAKDALRQAQLKYDQETAGVDLTLTTTSSGIKEAREGVVSAREKLNSASASYRQQVVNTPTDIDKAKSQLEAARSAVASAQSNLASVQAASDLALTNATEQLHQAQATDDLNKKTEQRQRQLVEQGFAAKADYDVAHAARQISYSQVRASEKNLSETKIKVKLDISTARDQLNEALQTQRAAKASLQAALAEKNLVDARSADVKDAVAAAHQAIAALKLAEAGTANNTIKYQNVQLALAAVRQAEQVVAYQEAQVAKSYIRSPISGTVLQLSAQQGETIAAGLSAPTVILVADLNRLQVDAYVDETDITKIKLGQVAHIAVDAFSGRKIDGKVVKIASGSTIQQGVVTYDVTIAVSNEKHDLKPDMTANVTIETGKRSDVLLVPAIAIQQSTKGSTVNVLKEKDGKKTMVAVPVKTGGTDGVNVEVLDGLKEGDSVVLAGTLTQAKTASSSNPFGPAPRSGGGGGGGVGGR